MQPGKHVADAASLPDETSDHVLQAIWQATGLLRSRLGCRAPEGKHQKGSKPTAMPSRFTRSTTQLMMFTVSAPLGWMPPALQACMSGRCQAC